MIHTFLLVKTVPNNTVEIIKWDACLMACIVSLAKTVFGSTMQIIKWKVYSEASLVSIVRATEHTKGDGAPTDRPRLSRPAD